MRIPTKDLPFQLKRGLAPVYCVLGDEPLQQQEALDTLREAAKTQGYTEREVFEITPHFQWDRLMASAEHLSLFASQKIIECRFSDTGKIDQKASDTLLKLLNTLSDTAFSGTTNPGPNPTLLLLSIPKLDFKAQQANWFTTLERKGCVVLARKPSPNELSLWIQKRLSNANLQASPEAIHLLLQRTEGNLLAAAQAIERIGLCNPLPSGSGEQAIKNSLLLYREESPVFQTGVLQKLRCLATTAGCLTPKDILDVVGQEAQFSIYDLVDALLAGAVTRTTQIFTCLKDQGIDPILILWAITREIRVIIGVRGKMKQGEVPSVAFKAAGIWKHRESLMGNFVQRFSQSHCQLVLQQAQKIDEILKGRTRGNAWDSLFSLCLFLTGASGKEMLGCHEYA